MNRWLVLLLLPVFAPVVYGQEVIPLYRTIPNYKAAPDEEKAVTGSDGILRIEAVQKPTLTIYLPPKEKATGTAVIICPGGGYRILAFDKEGTVIAKKLNEWGVAAFVVKYRIPDDRWMLRKDIGPLQDAQRALQLVRENAEKWNVDTGRVGIMGFSAGGHLASSAATHFQQAYIDNPAGISLRPSFQVLLYPVISLNDSICHKGSKDNLVGTNPAAETVRLFSNELQVNAATPPAFIVHASDDKAVSALNSVSYYEALLKNNIPAELHLYERGGHGFGLHNKTTRDEWIERLYNWMEANEYITGRK